MASDTSVPDTQEAPVGGSVVERVAERTGVDPTEIAITLVAMHGELLGRHGAYERRYEYVTVDGTRAYRVDEAEWDELAADFDLEEDLAMATEQAHTEQAGLFFARSSGVEDTFEDDEAGIVIGIDTAEQF